MEIMTWVNTKYYNIFKIENLFQVGNSSWLCSDGEEDSYFMSAQPDRSDCKGFLEILSICEVDTKFD